MRVTSVGALGRRLLSQRRGRTAMTTAGIVLGVALFTGSLLTTTTATRGLDRFAQEANGQAEVVGQPPGGSLSSIVSPRAGGIDPSLVGVLRSDPDVQDAVGLFGMASSFEGPEGHTEQRVNFRFAASLVGADLDAARSIYVIDIADGRLPVDGADEIVLPADVADSIGVTVGDLVTVTTADGARPIPLVGVLADRGLGRLDRIGFTSLETATRLADTPGAISQIAVDLADDVDADAWVSRTQERMPAGVVLSTSAQALSIYRNQIGALTGALLVLGGGLLLTAAFLIYLTLSMSVAERTRLYGTMLALGATRRQIRRVVLAEALAPGIVGTAAGVAVGIGVAVALLEASSRLLQLFARSALVISPIALLASFAVGIGVTVLSALVPARRAAHADPVAAIQATDADSPIPAGSWTLAAVMVAVGAAMLALSGLSLSFVGLVLVGVGAVRLVPHVLGPVARAVGPLTARLSPGGGRIAVQHLVAERTRSAYTLALVMIVMAMTVAISAIYLSFTSSLERQLTIEFGDDLQVSAASALPDSFLDQLRGVDGVAGVTPIGNTTASFTTESTSEDVYLEAIDPDTYFDVASYPFAAGDADAVVDAFTDDGSRAVVLPEATARRLDVSLGETITLGTLQGPLPFDVVAIVESSNVPARFVVSDASAEELFGISHVQEAYVRTAPAADPEVVRTRIVDALGDTATFIVTTSSELKADTRAQIGGGINAFFVLLVLAGVVGTFGLANTMAVSVFKRYREIGVLRAIGAERRQIRGMAVVEALTLVAVALVLALPLGTLLSRPLLATTQAQIGDLSVDYQTPWIIVPILAVVGLVVAFLAAIWPANRAAHLEIDTALRFE